ncbi:hypothetical protein D5086_027902 [Populus alba]|uniref:Uncharacterized protein n=1 Tax=Populus alba TaxID=43335 RepID=A0ACC4AWQ2_POPAL
MEDQSQPSPPPPLPQPPPPLKTYKITASSISYVKSTTTSNSIIAPFLLFKQCTTTPPSYILKEVSLTAYPSQILAVVGPSGAGKSTLLDILAARTSPTSGILLLNSTPINPSSFRKLSAYVPQHDACLQLLTVSETFTFAARLLNPKSSQIATIVESLLNELNLTHLANARLAHGLSGGERRRVSIGLSLLHDPGTVVHHGSLSSLESFLLSNGFTVPPQLNALEYAMEILNQLQESKPNTPPSLPPSPDNSTISPSDNKARSVKNKSSRLHEICVLYSRFWKIIYRTRQLLLTNTLEALVVGLVLGTIYINLGYGKQGIEKRFGLFAFTLTFLLSSTTETLPIFINERPILLRETSSGLYKLSSYLIANTLVFLPYLLAIAIIYSVSIYFMVGLCGTWQAFAYFVLVIWVIVLMGNSFVLFLSSLAPNYIAGTSLVTILLGGFFLFSGYFISQDSMPKYWLFMHFFSMYKYALDALLINEYSCLVNKCFLWYQENSTCMVTGGDVLQKRGLHERQRWTNIYILLGFFVFYRVLCLLVLIRRVSRSKK